MMKKSLLTVLACTTMAVLLNGCSCDMRKKDEPKVETPAAVDVVATEVAPETATSVDAVATEVAPESTPAEAPKAE